MKKKLQLNDLKVKSFQTGEKSVGKTVKGGAPFTPGNTGYGACSQFCTEDTFCDTACFTNEYVFCKPF